MDIGIFTNKDQIPTKHDLIESLGSTYFLWENIRKSIYDK